MLTAQQIFDTVKQHLLKQNYQSMDSAGDQCAYRGEGGNRCAIGFLIPDDRYDPCLEGKLVQEAPVKAALSGVVDFEERCPNQETTVASLLLSLQLVHDEYQPSVWASELARVAHNHGLNP